MGRDPRMALTIYMFVTKHISFIIKKHKFYAHGKLAHKHDKLFILLLYTTCLQLG